MEEESSLQEQERDKRFCVSMKPRRPREITASLKIHVALEHYCGSVSVGRGKEGRTKEWKERREKWWAE